MALWINQIYLINKVLSGNPDFRELDWLSLEEKKQLADELLANVHKDDVNLTNIINCIGYLIPRIAEEIRLGYAARILDLLEQSDEPAGRSKFQVLEGELIRSLSYADRIEVANILKERMSQNRFMARESSMWGLVRVIPFLREIHQKEFAFEIHKLSQDSFMRQNVMEALCTVIFSLNRENRTDMVLFFAEVLKKEENPLKKIFVLELLKKVTSSIPQKDRALISDCAAVLLFNTDPDIVHKTLDYFGTVISFLPPDQRVHYADMMLSLVNDMVLREPALLALEKILPFLATEHEKEPVRKVLSQFQDDVNKARETDPTYSVEAVLYAYEQ